MRIYLTTSGIFQALPIPNIRKYIRNCFSKSRKSKLEGNLSPGSQGFYLIINEAFKVSNIFIADFLWFDELIGMGLDFSGDLASLDNKILQLPEPTRTIEANRHLAEKLFDQWLSLRETNNQVKLLLFRLFIFKFCLSIRCTLLVYI